MAVLIDNQQQNQPLRIPTVQKRAQAILNALGCPDGELSVLLVDDPHIAEINETYLKHQGPTNVISFSMREGEGGDLHPELLGDVVISMDTCAREAELGAIPMERRLYELLVHGILHLFGYDHVDSEAEAEVMESKSRELLALIGENESQSST
ncbi:MAG: rRNA maturation RNase YbeY [Desulfatitalea sp.]|nr:rRNA maturation RNase YbeY [Desulfatitalea sp.]MBI5897213.1 rRNA maturation RNase YbeY [Desulfobacterales bacterium]